MKKIAVLALVLALLLSGLAARGEYAEPEASPVSTLELTNLSISHIEGGRAQTARLRNMGLSLSVGRAGGVPTLQGSFDNGKGQLMDVILQVDGTRLLVSVGGVSGTYYVDLAEASDDAGDGERLARGMASGLALAGPHLDGLLQGLSTVNSRGERRVRLEIPGDVYTTVASAVLKVASGLDVTGKTDFAGLMAAMEETKESAALILSWDADGRKLELDAVQGGQGLRLEADMALTVQPMVLVNISGDTLMYDLTRLDAMRMMELRGELAIIALKYSHFAGGTGLNRVLN